jgi:hypothetical protein
MAIITISRGCSSCGKEIAERVAEMLGYQCVSRDILIQAPWFFGVPETKLRKSPHDAPTILDRITRAREGYLSYVQAALKGISEAEVTTDRGRVNVSVRGQKLRKTGSASDHVRREVREQIRADLSVEVVEAVLKIPGVKELVCVVDLPYYS